MGSAKGDRIYDSVPTAIGNYYELGMDVHGGGSGQLTSYHAVLPCGPVRRIKSGHTTF